MAIPVYLWLKDDGGADIKGSVDVKDREGSIEVLAHGSHKWALAHDCPPNTSTPRNKQAGDECPTRMTWLGSPLPQNSVP